MKRLAATTIFLGVMVLALLLPVALLFGGALVLILDRMAGGVRAGAGGFSLSLRRGPAGFLIILMLAALVSWLTQKILRRQNRAAKTSGALFFVLSSLSIVRSSCLIGYRSPQSTKN